MTELEKNYNFTLDHTTTKCFLEQLHENMFFDPKLLNDLIKYIILLIEGYKREDRKENLQRDLSIQWQMHEVYTWTIEHLNWHYNPADGYKIKNNSKEKSCEYMIYVNRLRFVIKCFHFQDYQSILDYEDELGKLVEDTETS